jgi:hypothetical protein
MPGQREQERANEELESDEGGGRISRQSEDRLSTPRSREPPEAEWTSRPHTYAPEALLEAEVVENPLDKVGLTHGSTPDGDQDVRVCGVLDQLMQIVLVIPGGSQQDGNSGRVCDGRCEHGSVRVGNAGSGTDIVILLGRAQFVTRGQNRDRGTAHYGNRR